MVPSIKFVYEWSRRFHEWWRSGSAIKSEHETDPALYVKKTGADVNGKYEIVPT